jgi:hypothetical protein
VLIGCCTYGAQAFGWIRCRNIKALIINFLVIVCQFGFLINVLPHVYWCTDICYKINDGACDVTLLMKSELFRYHLKVCRPCILPLDAMLHVWSPVCLQATILRQDEIRWTCGTKVVFGLCARGLRQAGFNL